MPSPGADSIPRFLSSLAVAPIAEDLLLILNERRRTILRGRAVALVGGLIDGERSIGTIHALVERELSLTEVLNVLEQLTVKGYVTGAAKETSGSAGFWESQDIDGGAALDHLRGAAVAMAAAPPLDTVRLAKCLNDAGLGVDPDSHLRVVLTDDYLRAELTELCETAGRSHAAVLLVRPTGPNPSIGPLIAPDATCLACFQYWIRLNRPVEALLTRELGKPFHLPAVSSPDSEQAVFGLLSSVIARHFAAWPQRSGFDRSLLTIDLSTHETRRHQIVRRPQCPCCGDPAWMRRQAETAPALTSVRRLLCRDGGYRQRDPGETYALYRHLISPVCGPVAYLHPMPRRHAGMRKVYVAGYLVCPQELPRANSFDKTCAGKGQTDEQARASALCEALERYSGVYQGDEACLHARVADLDGRAIGFDALQNFSAGQFSRRMAINARTHDRRRQVPQRLDESTPIDWTPAWSLVSGKRHYVPLSYCYAEAPASAGAAYGIHNPNGAAAGNCREEAILQGLLELVERDATAIWWYNQIPRPAIDLRSFDDPYFDSLVADYAAAGWQLWVLDLTHDLGIAVCAAIASKMDAQRFAIGFGAHLSAHLAVQRALTEVNQLFDPAGLSPAPWDHAGLTDSTFLFPCSATPLRGAGDLPSCGGADLLDDIRTCISRLAARDMDVLVVDKTRPDIGLCVMQVIVPGLRHFWPRFGPGRLYDVPVALCWLDEPRTEDGLNPVALFL
jgi:ribosomal protein S12 methylthiotransferase accessory factor